MNGMDGWTGRLTDGRTERGINKFIAGWTFCLWFVILLANNDKRTTWLWMDLACAHFGNYIGPGSGLRLNALTLSCNHLGWSWPLGA